MTKISDALTYGLTIRESATDGSDFTNPIADYRRLFLGEDGSLHLRDSAGIVTAIGGAGDITTDAAWAAKGDLIVGTANNTAAVLTAGTNGKVLTAASGEATGLKWDTAAAGGITFGQAVPYPTTFTGDTIGGSSATPFADVAAFDVKEVLNSRVLHLRTLGASKDQRVRVTLGTTKAAAFDVTTAFAYDNLLWSAVHDYYLEIKLSTAADGTLAIARLGAVSIAASGVDTHVVNTLRVGSTSISAVNTNIAGYFELGETVTLRIVRDGSDKLAFFYGHGTAPLALTRVKDIATSNVPYNPTSAGTLARVEYAMHTPSGPGATVQSDTYIDYLQSV